ncbi:uncharacterized protein LOC129581435 [Paramacrobiotus metropolitanus]|uniref:uncharacterized protein LOC129581435 n=1 Tax=Paramacrobiotus metropolitanus TaxID=2943436 RepID=UPI002445AB42|nr:uncharacterized protein LOC129581435 [Paramacrobiotus metropolitanus]
MYGLSWTLGIATVIIVVCASATHVTAIRCYVCESSKAPACSDPSQLSTALVDNCQFAAGENVCFKRRGPGSLTQRNCMLRPPAPVDGCQIDKDTGVETCICSGRDLCNKSPALKSLVIVMAICILGIVAISL